MKSSSHLNVTHVIKVFQKKFDLKRHCLTVHSDGRQTPVKCVHCEKEFKIQVLLNIRVHNEVKSFNCNQCDKQFQTQRQLKNHVTCVHEKLKSFECKFCSKTFGST